MMQLWALVDSLMLKQCFVNRCGLAVVVVYQGEGGGINFYNKCKEISVYVWTQKTTTIDLAQLVYIIRFEYLIFI